jgi:hypothetical protein
MRISPNYHYGAPRQRRRTKLPEGYSLDGRMCTPEIVIQAVTHECEIMRNDLISAKSSHDIVYPRQLALYFISMNDQLGSLRITERFGKDHSMLFAARKRIEDLLDVYPETRDDIMKIGETIKWLYQLEKEIIMNEISVNRIRYMYLLLDQLGIRHMKNDLVSDASSARTESVRELSKLEMDELIKHLEQKLRQATRDVSPKRQAALKMDRMKKRIFSICYTIGWTTIDPEKNRHIVDQERLRAWMLKYGYLHKELNDYTYLELPPLVTQFEQLLKSVLATFKPE